MVFDVYNGARVDKSSRVTHSFRDKVIDNDSDNHYGGSIQLGRVKFGFAGSLNRSCPLQDLALKLDPALSQKFQSILGLQGRHRSGCKEEKPSAIAHERLSGEL